MTLDLTYALLLKVLEGFADKTDSKVDDVLVSILRDEGDAIKRTITKLVEEVQDTTK